MTALDEAEISCPYCGECMTVLIDTSIAEQSYVEDCQVCCSPILMHIEISETQDIHLSVQQENG